MVAEKALSEAEKLRRVPGIVYVDGAFGRRAKVMGALDVWEVIREFKQLHGDRVRLATMYDWMTADQLDAALTFYAAFPEEIDARLAAEDGVTPETLYVLYPELPRPRRS